MPTLRSILIQLLTMLVFPAAAQSFSSDGLSYTVHRGDKVILTGCTLTQGDVTIPSAVRNGDILYTVDSISPEAFRSVRNVINVSASLPSTVTGIGNGAFRYSRVNMEGRLVLPPGLKYLGNGAFSSKKISGKVVLPKSIIAMGEDVFDKCAQITSVDVLCTPQRTANFQATLGQMQALKHIYFGARDWEGSNYLARGNNTDSLTLTVGRNVRILDLAQFNGLKNIYLDFESGDGDTLTIQNTGRSYLNTIKGNFRFSHRPLVLRQYAFAYATLDSVRLDKNLVKLEGAAFNECPISHVEYYAAIDSVENTDGNTVFTGINRYDAKGYDLIIGRDVTYIPTYLFGSDVENRGPGVKTLTFQDGSKLRALGPKALCGNALLTAIKLPATVTEIGTDALTGCPFTELTIPENVTTYGSQYFPNTMEAFYYNAINARGVFVELHTKRLEIGPKVKYVDFGYDDISGGQVFADVVNIRTKILEHIGFVSNETDSVYAPQGLFPTTLKYLGRFITNFEPNIECGGFLRLPDNIVSSQPRHFRIENLRKIYLGNQDNPIENYVSDWRTQTVDTVIVGTNMRTFSWLHYNFPKLKRLLFTEDCPLDSIGRVNTSELVGELCFPPSLRTIGPQAFEDAVNITTIRLPDGLRDIGNSAFKGCINLSGPITLPDGLISIQAHAFGDCKSLNCVIELPASLQTLDCDAFSGASISKILIPDSDQRLNISTVTRADGGWVIKTPAKESAEPRILADKELYQGRTVDYPSIAFQVSTRIRHCSPFNNDTTLVSATIGDRVTKIGRGQFMNDTRLRSVHIGAGVDTLCREAFAGCAALQRIEIASKSIPKLEGSYWDSSEYDIFRGVPVENCELAVDATLVTAYKASSFWNKFKIVGLPPAGTDNITADADAPVEVARYNMQGVRLYKPAQGINIIRYSNGTTAKVYIK